MKIRILNLCLFHLSFTCVVPFHVPSSNRFPKTRRNSNFSKDFEASSQESTQTQQFIRNSDNPTEILNFVFENSKKCNQFNICAAIFKVAKISKISLLTQSESRLLQRLIKITSSKVAENKLTARQLSNLLVSLARLKYADPTLLSTISGEFLKKVHFAKSHEVVMVLWALSTLNIRDEKMFGVCVDSLRDRMEDLKLKEICTLCWALANSDHFDLKVLESSSHFVQMYSNVAWKAGKSLPAKDLCMIAWAFSNLCSSNWTLRQCAVDLMITVLEPNVLMGHKSFQPTDIAQLVTSMSKLSYDSQKMFEVICEHSCETIDNFTPKELSALLFSLAKMNFEDKKLSAAISKRAIYFLEQSKFSSQEISNLAWAASVLDLDEPTLIEKIFLKAQNTKELKGEELRQLYQAWVIYRIKDSNVFKNVKPNFLARAAAAWKSEKKRLKKSSGRHIEISNYLKLMNIAHRNESDHDIDIEVVGMGMKLFKNDETQCEDKSHKDEKREPIRLKLALEIDGPGHYTCNTQRPLGHTVLKHRILEQMGWKVIQVPFFQWDKIPFWASMERKRYLQRKLGINRTIYFGENDWSTYSPINLRQKMTRFD